MSEQDVLRIERRDRVAILRMNRPDARNAVDESLRGALIAALQDAAVDPAVGALVLTGVGSAFCAGGDIAGMKARLEQAPGAVAAQGWQHQRRNTHRLVTLLAEIEKPVVAAVNGAAAGLGADLAIACDHVIASTAAKFAYSYILRGLIPDGGGLYFLPRRIGMARAKDLIFSGRTVGADEALAIGLVDRLADPDRLVDDAVATAAAYAAGSPVALGLAKSILNHSHETSLDSILSAGAAAQGICYASDEHRRSVTDFLTGRR